MRTSLTHQAVIGHGQSAALVLDTKAMPKMAWPHGVLLLGDLFCHGSHDTGLIALIAVYLIPHLNDA